MLHDRIGIVAGVLKRHRLDAPHGGEDLVDDLQRAAVGDAAEASRSDAREAEAVQQKVSCAVCVGVLEVGEVRVVCHDVCYLAY